MVSTPRHIFKDTIVITAFLLAGALLFAVPVRAATATAMASATLISPTEVAIDAAELLQSASTGVLTLSIPGAGASGVDSAGASAGMTMTSTGVVGNTIIFSTTDSATLASLVQTLAASGGSLGIKGILSTGQGVSLSVTNAVQDGNGTVYAVIAYN